MKFLSNIVNVTPLALVFTAPIPTAVLVATSLYGVTFQHTGLVLAVVVSIAGAVVIELANLAVIHKAMDVWQYTQVRSKSELPISRAVLIILGILLVANLAVSLFAIAAVNAYPLHLAFPFYSLGAALVAGISANFEAVKAQNAENKAERRAARSAQHTAQPIAQHAQNSVLGSVNAAKQAKKAAMLESLVTVYANNPHIGATEAAQQLGVHRNTVGNYTNELIEAGRLHKNGAGWAVMR